MKELRDLDLGGAPYGYTPFCDSRTEMDGFRFWKQGYWRSHLQGRRYHISALYVVDLRRFRRIAAGDRLRGQYQALSQDPNSLSNLDQVWYLSCTEIAVSLGLSKEESCNFSNMHFGGTWFESWRTSCFDQNILFFSFYTEESWDNT
jgi:hypothetical protein